MICASRRCVRIPRSLTCGRDPKNQRVQSIADKISILFFKFHFNFQQVFFFFFLLYTRQTGQALVRITFFSNQQKVRTLAVRVVHYSVMKFIDFIFSFTFFVRNLHIIKRMKFQSKVNCQIAIK